MSTAMDRAYKGMPIVSAVPAKKRFKLKKTTAVPGISTAPPAAAAAAASAPVSKKDILNSLWVGKPTV